MKIDICITRIRYTFLEKQRLHQNRYFYNLKHVYISGNQRTSSKLIFLSRGTGIHFWKSTYFIKIDIFITWNRYTILEINVLHENRYLYNLNQVYISGKTTTSSKLIFSQRETGIYFLISTNFFKINIFIPWNRYTFREINVLHANRYLYNLNQVYITENIFWYQRTSSKLIFLSHETGIHFGKSTYFMQIDICITWIILRKKQRVHQNWYFLHVKQVYICWYQRTSSKLIFLSREAGIHFWNSTYIIKIDIFITWNVYTILEINILHQNWYF